MLNRHMSVMGLRENPKGKGKGKEEYLYSAFLHQGTLKALRRGSHSFTCKQHHACLSFVAFHQMSPPQQLRQQTSNCSSLLIYRPRKDERLSWPSWLTYSGWLTHISGRPSAASRAQVSERTPAKDRCSTAGPRNQPVRYRSECATLRIIHRDSLGGATKLRTGGTKAALADCLT